MNIPLPVNGYWQKLQFKKPVEIKKLPGDYTGNDEVVFGEAIKYQINDSPSSVQAQLVKEIENSSGLPLNVPDILTKPDILITCTQNYLDAVRRHTWSSGAKYPSRTNVLNIDVSKDHLPRALRIMNAIIALLRARGHSLIAKEHHTLAIVYNEEIKIRLREKYKRTALEDKYSHWENTPTGKLVLIIGENWRSIEINDGMEGLEKKMSFALAKLEILAKKEIADRIERERQHKIYEEEKRLKRELKARREQELTEFKKIFWAALRYNQANFLRDYIITVETTAKESGSLTEEKQQWIAWAIEKIDWYDPLINKEDQLLDDLNKNTLMKELLTSQDGKESMAPWVPSNYF